jgi:hypothetical protein
VIAGWPRVQEQPVHIDEPSPWGHALAPSELVRSRFALVRSGIPERNPRNMRPVALSILKDSPIGVVDERGLSTSKIQVTGGVVRSIPIDPSVADRDRHTSPVDPDGTQPVSVSGERDGVRRGGGGHVASQDLALPLPV